MTLNSPRRSISIPIALRVAITGSSRRSCRTCPYAARIRSAGNDSNLLIVFYVQIMPDDFVMQLHRF
ncbi:hypothetical protein C2U54_23885 (plasmid) [Leclercia sp. LSNIH1]|nr:hypothetical protein C2U54_23885 [Leclercia sp. LSNIH1]